MENVRLLGGFCCKTRLSFAVRLSCEFWPSAGPALPLRHRRIGTNARRDIYTVGTGLERDRRQSLEDAEQGRECLKREGCRVGIRSISPRASCTSAGPRPVRQRRIPSPAALRRLQRDTGPATYPWDRDLPWRTLSQSRPWSSTIPWRRAPARGCARLGAQLTSVGLYLKTIKSRGFTFNARCRGSSACRARFGAGLSANP